MCVGVCGGVFSINSVNIPRLLVESFSSQELGVMIPKVKLEYYPYSVRP